ncbi:MAG: DUF4296 domain-containing protein [Bacteroidales bacterium]|nr:DUF4296 domain-containing protein [Bacteroidales bacterium]
MKSCVRHILVAFAALFLLCSCGDKARIIPRGVMSDIYAEMLLADQWLEDHQSERSRADTMLFYDPIFKRYGYTFEDYDASVRKYLEDPEKFSKVFRDASLKLKDKRDEYRKISEHLNQIKEFNAAIKGYQLKDFDKDTFLWCSPYKDSLRKFIADSLLRDSLFRDSLLRDSLFKDSLRVDSLRRDSLKRSLREARLARRRTLTNIKIH